MIMCGSTWRAIQRDLVVLMGELATVLDDLPRYVKDGHGLVTAGMTARLDGLVAEIEAAKVIRQRLGPAGSERGLRGARCRAHGLPPGGETRMRVAGSRSTPKPGDTGLSEPAVRPAMALGKAGGDKAGVSRGPSAVKRLSSQLDTPGTFRPHDAVRI